MRKYKGYIIAIIFAILCICINTNYCSNAPVMPGVDKVQTDVKDIGTKVWNTAKLILRMFAFGAILFSGLMYMFSAADRRAEIKSKLIILAIGASIVFGATTLVDFISGVGDSILK